MMTKVELQQLVDETVSELFDMNEKVFTESNQLMTPLSSQIAVHAVLKILQKYDIFPKCED